MELKIERFAKTITSTIGRLTVDGKLECYTLEDADREKPGVPVEEWKIFGATAIPRGAYNVVVDYSGHFERDLPHVLNVPGFAGIRIHSGNDAEDTEGCILVGTYDPNHPDWVSRSRDAFEKLFAKIRKALHDGNPVTLEIV